MSNPRGTYFDGGEETFRQAYQVGPTVPNIDSVTRGLVYTQTMRQRFGFWKALPWGKKGPHGSFLVEETTPGHVGGGLIEWQRIYWTVPPPRKEPLACAHSYQYREGYDIGEITQTVRSEITYTYFHTLKPEDDIPLERAFRWFKIGSRLAYIGTIPPVDATIILAEDETYRRIMGHVYEKTSKQVPTLVHALIDPP